MADSKSKPWETKLNQSIPSEEDMIKYMGMKRHPVSGKLYTPGGPMDDTKNLKSKPDKKKK